MKAELIRFVSFLPPIALICGGMYLVYPPASLIALGVLWIAAALPARGNK